MRSFVTAGRTALEGHPLRGGNFLDAQKKGYDGAIIRDGKDGNEAGPVQYVAFRPEQIKSAIGNRGTFSVASRSG